MNTDYKKHTPQIEDQRNQLTQIEDCQTYKNTQATSPQQKAQKKPKNQKQKSTFPNISQPKSQPKPQSQPKPYSQPQSPIHLIPFPYSLIPNT